MGNSSAWAISALFTAAGVGHFVRGDAFDAIVPDWMPNAKLVVAVSGVDIHIDANGDFQRYVGEVPDLRNWIRLPFQFLLIAWVWRHARSEPRDSWPH